MTSLDDLFASPGASRPYVPPARSPRSPTPPSRLPSDAEPLFFSPSASIASPQVGLKRKTPPPAAPPQPVFDLEAFADDDELYDLPPPLPPPGQVSYGDSLTRDPLALGDPLALTGEEPQPGQKKARRPIPKINAERLMSDRGIPALMKAAKRFKPRRKGAEVSVLLPTERSGNDIKAADLRDLLEVYQMWAHGMFPKGDFAGTIARVEKVCHSRRMESAMKGYREAFYPPKPRTPSPPLGSSQQERASSPAVGSQHPATSSPPLRVGTQQEDEGAEEEALFDGPDLDELRAMEEMEDAGRPKGNGTDTDEPPALDEEDEWEGLYD